MEVKPFPYEDMGFHRFMDPDMDLLRRRQKRAWDYTGDLPIDYTKQTSLDILELENEYKPKVSYFKQFKLWLLRKITTLLQS